MQVAYGLTYGKLPIPMKTGYSFLGWYTEQENGIKIENNTKVELTNNQTLYAHWKEITPVKGSLAELLINKANDNSITDYNSGNKAEMYTFKQEATEQTQALTEYRYIGKSPNNYINFNDEIWRIIGVFTVENENGEQEQRIKIVRNTLMQIAWDKNKTSEWPSSTLSILLNQGDYYQKKGNNSTNGLSELSRAQISKAKWYLGSTELEYNISGEEYYNFERGSKTCLSTGKCNSERSISTFQNVGLMYPSDYVYTYAYGVNEVCYTNVSRCYQSDGNANMGWLYKYGYNQWLITHYAGYSSFAMAIDNDGRVDYGYETSRTSDNFEHPISAFPTVYLKSTVQIKEGDGSKDNPYHLKKPDYYIVGFDSMGGINTINEKEVYIDSPYGDLPVPTKDGYSFLGWYTESERGELITSDTILKETHNHTLYAHWKKLPFNITNDNYYFNLKDNTFTSNNQGKGGTTAKTTITFTESNPDGLTINWSVDSEASYDKLTITYNGTKKVNAVSGTGKSGKFTINNISIGDIITFEYVKDSSADKGTDTATITIS